MSLFSISDAWKCLKFGFKVGGASWRARKRETKVLRDAHVEVSETLNLFYLIWLKKVANKDVNYNFVWAIYPEIPRGGLDRGIHTPPKPILDKNSPTGVWLTNAHLFRIEIHIEASFRKISLPLEGFKSCLLLLSTLWRQ